MARYVLLVEWAMKETAFSDEYEYTRVLLRERKQELQALELRHRQKLTPPDEYASCRRSLLQGIHELETLLRISQSSPKSYNLLRKASENRYS